MPLDRDATLKKAEKLIRQGRLEPAIAEYVRVVEDFPRDWSTANTLGELFARAGKPDQAVEQYARIADHFVDEGFYPKAAALFKKILKLRPQDETTQIKLADISARQGLLADAKAHLNAVAARRRAKGDRRGAAEIIVRLGTIDPADFEARLEAARTLEQLGEEEEAGNRFKTLHTDLLEKGRVTEAMDALKEFVRINPLERESRAVLSKSLLETGDLEGAREFLDEDSAGDDPGLLLPLIDMEIRSNELGKARVLMGRMLTADVKQADALLALGWAAAEANVHVTSTCVEAVVDSAVARSEYEVAVAQLRDFTSRIPGQIPALLKLVEVCVDGGLEQEMYDAQERLADAYLAANQASEARVIAEDLVAREPWEAAHIDRFRRALLMLRVSDPDTVIAERLSGQAPFMAHDPFFDEPEIPPVAAPAPAEAAAAPAETEQEEQAMAPEVVTNAVPDSGAASPYSSHADVPPLPVEPEAPAPRSEIDLTGALGHAPAPVNLSGANETAAEGRGGGAEPDFSTQHMTLARTYMEIGMTDEAISALQTAVRSPRHRFEAAAMLGRLYDRRGESKQAIEWLERAAEAQAASPDDARALLYDLGVALEGAAETSRALAVFLELQSEAGDYRDVPGRIDRLARVQAGG